MKLKRIISWIFFPERCSICGEIKPFLKSYCPKCKLDTKAIDSGACPDCGHSKCMCDSGFTAKLRHFTAVYYYEGQIKKSLHKFKFCADSSYAEIFGKAMAQRIRQVYTDTNFDGICFVPMTAEAEIHRGYNQSELLASEIAKELSIELLYCLEKTRSSPNQKDLSAKERTDNVKDSFAVTDEKAINGKTIILCDDIKTTGATLKECSDTLIKAGAKDVYCVCLALTPYINYTDIF